MSEDVVEDVEAAIRQKKFELSELKRKRKRYTTTDFLNDVHSSEPNNVKAVTKAITAGCKVFVKESPHPFVGFLKETAKEVFS